MFSRLNLLTKKACMASDISYFIWVRLQDVLLLPFISRRFLYPIFVGNIIYIGFSYRPVAYFKLPIIGRFRMA